MAVLVIVAKGNACEKLNFSAALPRGARQISSAPSPGGEGRDEGGQNLCALSAKLPLQRSAAGSVFIIHPSYFLPHHHWLPGSTIVPPSVVTGMSPLQGGAE